MKPWAPAAAGFLFLSMLFVAAPPAADAQVATPETGRLVVTSFAIDSAPYHANGVANGTTVRVSVRNDGPVASTGYSLSYEWQPEGQPPSPMNGDAAASQDVDTDGPLAVGSTRPHTAQWSLQSNQSGPGRLVVTVRHGPNATNASLPVLIASHAVSLAIEDLTQDLAVEETRFVRINVSNQGNVQESVALSVPDAGIGNRSRLQAQLVPATLLLAPGAQANATLFVSFPFTGDTAPLAANFTVRAVWSRGNASSPTPVFRAQECCFPQGLAWSVERLGAGAFTVPPAQSRTLSFEVANVAEAGNASRSDTYRATAIVDQPWSAEVAPARLGLRPGEADRFEVTLTAPAGVPAGQQANLRFEVASDHAPSARRGFDVVVRAGGPAPTVTEVVTERPTTYAGEGVRAFVRIVNAGDETANASVARLRWGLPGQSTVTQTVTVPLLFPGQDHYAVFGLPFVPSIPGAGTLEAFWSPSANTPPQSSGTGTFEVRLAALQLVAPPGLTGVPGEDVSYQSTPAAFTLRNAGSHTQDVALAATARHGTAWLTGATQVTLAPGETRIVALVHRLPHPADGRASDNATVYATFVDRPAKSWNATVATAIADRQAPSVEAPPLPAHWSAFAPLPLAANASDDDRLARVQANVTRPDGYTYVVPLARASGVAWRAVLVMEHHGNHTVRFAAADGAGNWAQATAQSLQVVPAAPPRIALLDPPNGSIRGDLHLNFSVDSARPISSVMAWQAGDPANATELFLFPGRAELDLALLRLPPGPVTLVIEASNTAGARANLTLDLTIAGVPETAAGPVDGAGGDDREGPIGPVALVALAAAAFAARRARRGRLGPL